MISSVSSDSQITPAMEKRMIFQVSLSVRETIGTASPGGDSGSGKPSGAGISASAGKKGCVGEDNLPGTSNRSGVSLIFTTGSGIFNGPESAAPDASRLISLLCKNIDYGKPETHLHYCDKVSFVEGRTASPSTKRHDQEVNSKLKKNEIIFISGTVLEF